MKKIIGFGAICLLLFTVSALANSGGPDNFGYTWKDNLEPGGPSFSFIDITATGTRLGNGDDATFGPHDFGFSFPFYGEDYSQFYVSTNGLITLTEPISGRFNYCPVPDSGIADYWIAPFWDDLNMRPVDTSGIFYQYFDASVDYLVIQWYHFSVYSRYGAPMNMEAIIYADGSIVFQYNYVNDLIRGHGQEATIGIEKDHTDGLTSLCNDDNPANELYSGKVIEFYAPIINHDIAVNSIDQPTYHLVILNGSITVRATLQNDGLMADNFNAYLDILNSGGGLVFKDTIGMSLAPNATGLAIFSPWNVSLADSLTIIVTAGLSTDQIPDNNSISSYIKAMNVVSLPITQNFDETWPPPGWNVLDQSGDSSTFTASTIRARSPINSAQACYDAWGAPDDWLILPPINLAGLYAPRWDYYEDQSHWPANGLRHTLYVSTNSYFDPASATPIMVQTPYNHNINGFAGDPMSIDLSAYAGSSHVWLAYRYEQNSGANWDSLDYVMEYWWIDDVHVYEVPDDDVGIYSIDSPINYVRQRCDSPVEVTVENYGRQEQTFNVNVTITGNIRGIVYNNTVTNVWVGPHSNEIVSFPPLTSAASDSYTVVATTLLPSDLNPANNAMSQAFYVSTIIEHRGDDNGNEQCLVASPFNNSMLAAKFTPLDPDFTILDGNIYVEDYSPDQDGYAEYEWVKICPDAGGTPDLEHAYQTVEHVGTFIVPTLIPIDFDDIAVYNYSGDIWIVVKYADSGTYFLCTGSDLDNPRGYSYYNTQGDPPVWVQDSNENYMMRVSLQYNPCPGADPDIRISTASFTDTVQTHLTFQDTLIITNLGQAPLTYSLHFDRSWISSTPDSGNIQVSLKDTIVVSLNAATLMPGNYSGNIALISNDPDHPLYNLPVNLMVISGPDPDIIVSESSFVTSIQSGGSYVDTLHITNIGTAPLNYGLHHNRSWLTIIPDTGSVSTIEVDTLQVFFDARIAPGDYVDTIRVTSNDPLRPQLNLPVFMRVTAGPGPNCQYAVGDANNSGIFNGLDVTYSVAYFKGGATPPYSCECTVGNTWFVGGDVNASCNFNGVDVTYMVAYFKGGPLCHPCADCPPLTFDAPLVAPDHSSGLDLSK
jgi:hypothetical protein